MNDTDNVVPIRAAAMPASDGTDWAPILASGPGPYKCTRCASPFAVRTWHVVWPADSDRSVCLACSLGDPALRKWALRSIAADAIDRVLAETAGLAERRAVALALVSDVSWFANWRVADEYIDVTEPGPIYEVDDEERTAGKPPAPTAHASGLRRTALRAAKLLDRHVTRDDALLAALESAFGSGTDDELAIAVMAVVHAAEAAA